MTTETLRALYGYNAWATERVLDASAHLTAEQWLAPGNAGRGSIRDTLVHVIDAQRRWLSWWDRSLPAGEAHQLRYELSDFPDVESVRAAWTTVARATQSFLDGLSDADIDRDYTRTMPDGKVFRLPLWKMMLHVANHGTQHRSEVAAMLTGFDQSPGDLDMLDYFRPFDHETAG